MLPPQRPKDFDAALREARRFLLARGEVPSDALVGAVVARSWARSHAAGLSPDAHPPEFFHLAGLALAEAIDDRQMLLAHARPVMEYLHAQTRDSGSMVILADDHGVLLESLGDAEFLDRAGRVALAPGASWHERDRGTNAIGTALAEASAVVINGAEHFLDRNDFLTCAAAPVSAPDGRLLGVLDISGDHRRRHPHTLSLVHTAAQMLENRIFEVSHRGDIRLHLHPWPRVWARWPRGFWPCPRTPAFWARIGPPWRCWRCNRESWARCRSSECCTCGGSHCSSGRASTATSPYP
jgi:transcriptional regulator of acetoin/glycerol metabolism